MGVNGGTLTEPVSTGKLKRLTRGKGMSWKKQRKLVISKCQKNTKGVARNTYAPRAQIKAELVWFVLKKL